MRIRLSLQNILTDKSIATIMLVVMLTQNVYIEGYGISPIKVGLMALMPIILLIKVPYVSKAMILGIIYMLTIFLSGLFHIESFRFSTIGYLGMFVITFITLYNIIYSGAIPLSYFIKLLKWLILAYAICLCCQQVLVLIGIRFMPIVNLNNQFYLSINKLPSLSIEPSHSSRILGVLMYAYMECISFRDQEKFEFKKMISKEHIWVTIPFFWSMLTMGSGTAFIVMGILSLYFINLRNALIIIPILAGLIYLASLMDIKEFNRAFNTAQATMTLDNDIIAQTDGSASARITPIINTIKNLDLTKKEHWFGYGIDAGVGNKSQRMISEITDYGFLAYLFGLLFVFSCSIRILSIPTIMFFIGIGGGTGNIAYGWGILMIFMCIKYYKGNYQ